MENITINANTTNTTTTTTLTSHKKRSFGIENENDIEAAVDSFLREMHASAPKRM
jgi:hypothetical protein